MLTLYHQGGAVCAQKVRLALAEKGLEWQGVEPDLMDPATRREYLKLNPNAVVPTLVVDGKPIIESNVILEYLDEIGPEPPLHPADAYGRALMRIWLSQIDLDVHVSVNALSFAISLRHLFLQMPPERREAMYREMPDAEKRWRRRDLVEKGLDSFLVGIAAKRFQRLFADMERTLAAQEWLAGEGYTLADVAFTPYVHRMKNLGLATMWEGTHPRLQRWYERVQARPSFAEAILKYPPPVAAGGPLPGAGAPAVWPRIQKLLEAD